MQAAPASPAAHVQPLTVVDDYACTADQGACVGLVETPDGDQTLIRPVVRTSAAALPPASRVIGDVQVSRQPWSSLIRLPDGGYLAGVELGVSSMYSGGGGQAASVELYRLDAAGDAVGGPLLTVPIMGSLIIRACFGDKDERQRAGACHDEYSFEGRLATAPGASADGLPVLTYATTATAFPRGVSRMKDSLQNPPLKPADLVAQRDRRCSFERRFTFDAATGAYQPNRPLPDCSDYTVP